LILILTSLACLSAPTPEPGQLINIDNVCEFEGQLMDVEGQLTLPNGVSCTTTQPSTCDLYLQDPLSWNDLTFPMPVASADTDIPVNHMAALPAEYSMTDFYIRTADGSLAGNHSFVSVRGTVAMGRGSTNCAFSSIESVTRLERLSYPELDLTRVTLQQALSDGIVVASINGGGLTQINLTLKPTVELNLEIEIEPGTMFISGTEGVQNMVLRQGEIVYLKPELEVGLELEVSCANMERKQPEFSDEFTISAEPASEDVLKLLALEDFRFVDIDLQQFAIWTITDNPYDRYSYIAIESGGYSHLPQDFEIEAMRSLFAQAGIDTSKYLVFVY
jgi:hypothetical protein